MKGYLSKLKDILEDIKKIPTRQLETLESITNYAFPGNSLQKELKKDNEELLMKIEDYEKIINMSQEEKYNLQKIIEKERKKIDDLKQELVAYRNEILDLKGAIRVYCRIKPVKNTSVIKHSDSTIEIESKEFSIGKIFSDTSTQEDVFTELKMLIENIIDGYNVCVYAYGQTGSGKTYTMEGNKDGLIYQSLSQLEKIEEKLKLEKNEVSYVLKYIEIYNENVIDLFTGNAVSISDSGNNKIILKDVTEHITDKISDIREFIITASAGRKIGETNSNCDSSRSHAIFILEIEIKNDKEIKKGSLCLIDLAGSERLNESKAKGERLKETQNINRSLSALGNVFNAIKQQEKYIPYRNSKLTHVMQGFLSGQSRVIMIVNINPESTNESLCTLRFASRVSECYLGKTERSIKRIVK